MRHMWEYICVLVLCTKPIDFTVGCVCVCGGGGGGGARDAKRVCMAPSFLFHYWYDIPTPSTVLMDWLTPTY